MNATGRYSALAASLAVLAGAIFFYRTIELGRGDARPAKLEVLNPGGEFSGPEGIQFDSRGNLYIGDTQSRIWVLESGSIQPRLYCRLDAVIGADAPPGPVMAGGIAIDADDNLYVACYDYAGGSIIRIDSSTRRPSFLARGMGSANYVVITGDGSYLWASDFNGSGHLLRYPLGKPRPTQPDVVIEGFAYPNGLALGRGERSLLVAESYSGRILSVDLLSKGFPVRTLCNLKGAFAVGSLDGLAFDPRDRRRQFLYVIENLRGLFTILDLEADSVQPIKQIRLATMGGRPCPASMTIRDGYLYFTDLWSCNPFRILLRIPNYHTHAWRLPVTDLTLLRSGPEP